MNAIRNVEMEIKEINIEDIKEHPEVPNIRTKISANELKELIESIKVAGVMNPIACFRVGNDDNTIYIESGFRRLAACKELKIKTVPVIFKKYDKPVEQALFGNMIENVQRQDLNLLDLANRVKKLVEMGMEKDKIAKEIGKSRSWVDTTLKFLDADPALQGLVKKGELTLDEGKKIAKLDPEIQAKIGEGLAEAKKLESITGEKSTSKKMKKEIDEASRVRSSVAPGKKEIEAQHRKAEAIFKLMKSDIDPTKKPTTKQEVFWIINTIMLTLKYTLGLVKDLQLDKKGKDLGIEFDEKGYVVEDEEEEEKTEKNGKKKPAKAKKAPSSAKKAAKEEPEGEDDEEYDEGDDDSDDGDEE